MHRTRRVARRQPQPIATSLGCARVSLVAGALLLSGCKENPVKVDKLTLDGVSSIDERALREVLSTQSPGWVPFSKKPAFNQKAFDEDLKRITAFYADHGYPDAQVASVDVKFNDKKDAVRLTVHIKEGDPLRIADVRLRGFDSLPKASRAALDRAVTFHAGEPRDRQLVMQAQDAAVTAAEGAGVPLRKGGRPRGTRALATHGDRHARRDTRPAGHLWRRRDTGQPARRGQHHPQAALDSTRRAVSIEPHPGEPAAAPIDPVVLVCVRRAARR